MKGYSLVGLFRVAFLGSVVVSQIKAYNAERVDRFGSSKVKAEKGEAENISEMEKSTSSAKEKLEAGRGVDRSSFRRFYSSIPKELTSDFVFPDELERRPSSIRPPAVCEGSTFCENSRGYAEDFVNRAIERNDSLKLLQNEDTLSSVVQRIELSGLSGDVPLCVSKEEIVYPTSAESTNKEWLHVVNQRNFKQGVRIESCDEEQTACNLIGGLAHGYRTICKQKYVYRQLVAISSDGSVFPDFFRFPSCCCCHAEFDILSSVRMRQ